MKRYILFLSILLLMFMPVFGQGLMPGPMPGPVPMPSPDTVPGGELTLDEKVDWLYRFFSQFENSICKSDAVEPEPEEIVPIIKAIISGNFGSPENRITAGEDITLHSGKSSCGQGGVPYFTSSWAIGKHSGGEYLVGKPVIVGSEGMITSFRVPQMSATIDQEVILTIVCGEDIAKTRATVYLRPMDP